jgi:hypothetical protein
MKDYSSKLTKNPGLLLMARIRWERYLDARRRRMQLSITTRTAPYFITPREAIFVLALNLFVIFVLAANAFAKPHQHLEKEYQQAWCAEQSGTLEVVLEDSARVDCVTSEYAVEFDFAGKWAESIGQSLYYGLKLKMKPAVVLILENGEKDERFLKRLQTVAKAHGITVYTMTPAELTATDPIGPISPISPIKPTKEAK